MRARVTASTVLAQKADGLCAAVMAAHFVLQIMKI
jgi:hypothetical protein